VAHLTVEPSVIGQEGAAFRGPGLAIGEAALDRAVGVAMLAVPLHVVFFAEASAVLHFAGFAPIPVDDGRHAAACERRDVACLAGHLVYVAVELDADQLRFRMRRATM